VVVCRLLGPVAVDVDGEVVDGGSPRQRCVLAALLVEPNTVVPVEALVDRVWGNTRRGRCAGRALLGSVAVVVDLLLRAGGGRSARICRVASVDR
jgi:hypothetical protein